MNLEDLNLAELCRTCKCISSNMRSLFEGYENKHQSPRIEEMLMACASVQVTFRDGLPSQICQECVKQLRSAFVFKLQCEKIDASLREYVKNVQINEIKEEKQNPEYMEEDKVVDISYQDNEGVANEEVTAADSSNNIDISLDEDKNERTENRDMVEAMEEGENLMNIKVEDEESDFQHFEDDDILDLADDDNDSGGDSTDSEYLPEKAIASPRIKRGKGTPQKNTTMMSKSPKLKVPRKRKSRSPKSIKREDSDKEYDEFPCPACQEMFTTISQLEKHARQNHVGLNIHKCPECNTEFNRAIYLKQHIATHSSGKTCTICTKSFNREDYLKQHEKMHEGCDDLACDIGKMKKSRKYLCSVCGQNYANSSNLMVHMRRHRGEKPFKCKYCDKGFIRPSDVTVHERYHTGEKPHLCSVCGRGFVMIGALNRHMRIHTGGKPFKCTYCDAAFAQSNDLKYHVRRHTGERFQCELCPDNFLMGYLLNQHKRNVHGVIVRSNIRRLQPVDKLKNPAVLH